MCGFACTIPMMHMVMFRGKTQHPLGVLIFTMAHPFLCSPYDQSLQPKELGFCIRYLFSFFPLPSSISALPLYIFKVALSFFFSFKLGPYSLYFYLYFLIIHGIEFFFQYDPYLIFFFCMQIWSPFFWLWFIFIFNHFLIELFFQSHPSIFYFMLDFVLILLFVIYYYIFYWNFLFQFHTSTYY